jgi:hypothetical protein
MTYLFAGRSWIPTSLPEYPAKEYLRMSASATASSAAFLDRRGPAQINEQVSFERRQFANTYEELSPDAAELARAIDGYKVQHRRRFITFEEMLAVIKSLGYSR